MVIRAILRRCSSTSSPASLAMVVVLPTPVGPTISRWRQASQSTPPGQDGGPDSARRARRGGRWPCGHRPGRRLIQFGDDSPAVRRHPGGRQLLAEMADRCGLAGGQSGELAADGDFQFRLTSSLVGRRWWAQAGGLGAMVAVCRLGLHWPVRLAGVGGRRLRRKRWIRSALGGGGSPVARSGSPAATTS